jgi:hypothetical protein
MPNNRAPNWDKWRAIPDVKLWEGVALSLNIEPAAVSHSPNGWMADAHLFNESQEFKERLFVATRNVGMQKPLQPKAFGLQHLEDCPVSLREFATWAVSLNWRSLPEEFVAMADVAALPQPSLTEQERTNWLQKDLWRVREVAFLLCGRRPVMESPDDHGLLEAIDDIKRAVHAGNLPIVGESSWHQQLYNWQWLHPRDVILWAAHRFAKFPFSEADIPTPKAADSVAQNRPSQEERLDGRTEAACLNTIGALLHFLLKAGPGGGRPPFASQAKLIGAIGAAFPEVYGLSERELQRKFAEANRGLKSG